MFSISELDQLNYIVKVNSRVIAGFNAEVDAQRWAEQIQRNNRDRNRKCEVTIVHKDREEVTVQSLLK